MKNKYWVYLILFGLCLQAFTYCINADMGNENEPLLPIKIINNNLDWKFQGKHPVSGEWIDINDSVSFEKNTREDDSVKINITFTFPVVTDYRLDIVINRKVLDYIEQVGEYNYTINYSGILFYFDFYDMFYYSDNIQHGVIEYEGKDCLWVRFIKYDVHVPSFTIDPVLGVQMAYSNSYNIKNKITGINQITATSTWVADNISVYVKSFPDLMGGTPYLTCGLYRWDGAEYNLLSKTEEKGYGTSRNPVWIECELDTKCLIEEGKIYSIVAYSSTNCYCYYSHIFTTYHRIYQNKTYDSTLPNVLDSYVTNSDIDTCIFASGEYSDAIFSDFVYEVECFDGVCGTNISFNVTSDIYPINITLYNYTSGGVWIDFEPSFVQFGNWTVPSGWNHTSKDSGWMRQTVLSDYSYVRVRSNSDYDPIQVDMWIYPLHQNMDFSDTTEWVVYTSDTVGTSITIYVEDVEGGLQGSWFYENNPVCQYAFTLVSTEMDYVINCSEDGRYSFFVHEFIEDEINYTFYMVTNSSVTGDVQDFSLEYLDVLFCGMLELPNELILLILWILLFNWWFKSESEDMTVLLGVLFMPYTIFFCWYALPLLDLTHWIIQFVFIAIGLIVLVYSLDLKYNWRGKK